MDQESGRLRGECLCRRVAYEVPDAFDYALNCHCGNCRRTTGSAFKPFAGLRAEHLALVRGQGDVMRVGESETYDARCAHCGSLLFSMVRDATYVHVALGTLIDAPSIRPTAHIFVGSKAPWHDILDDLPQFEGLPTG